MIIRMVMCLIGVHDMHAVELKTLCKVVWCNDNTRLEAVGILVEHSHLEALLVILRLTDIFEDFIPNVLRLRLSFAQNSYDFDKLEQNILSN